MNDDLNDPQLDAALEALARPEPPADHVAHVLARTVGGDALGRGASLRRPVSLHPRWSLRPRWVLPVAATLVATVGMAWQLNRRIEREIAAETAGWASRPYQPHGWGAPQEIDRPVLPPQAYWGMDAFTEFERLRPGTRTRAGTQEHRKAGIQGRGTGHEGRRGDGNEALAWVPMPSGLPLIELESISPAPLELLPLAPLEDIALADIPFAPVVITQLTEEEHP